MTIELNGLTKSYHGKTLWQGLTARLAQPGLYLVTGPSGSGKTTLLRILAGLTEPDSGTVSGIGTRAMAFQEYRLLPQLSALENAAAVAPAKSREERRERCRGMLAGMGFTGQQMELKPDALSGGMKQRVSLCRALASNASLILLDEPMKELDAALRSVVRSLILEAATRSVVVVSIHEPGELAEAAIAVFSPVGIDTE